MSNVPQQTGKRFSAGRAAEYVSLAILLLASLPVLLLRPHSLTVVPDLNLIDGSWLLDTSYKAAHGIWFGRDVAFTYGPLYQWLSSAPSRMLGVSAGSIYATYNTLPLLLVVLATFLTVRMLLPDASPWKRLLIFVLAVVFWSPPDVRVSIALLAYRRVPLDRQPALLRTPRRTLWYSLAAALAILLSFLLSADTGLYSGAAFVLCTAAFLIGNRKSATARRQLLTYTALTVVCFALLMIATNAVMRAPFDFGYWKSSLAIAGGYRWFEATAMTKADKWRLLETLGLPSRCWRRRGDGAITAQEAGRSAVNFCCQADCWPC